MLVCGAECKCMDCSVKLGFVLFQGIYNENTITG